MAQLLTNTSFKLKAGVVADDSGLVPEAGALIFDQSIPALVVGDGFNFLPLGGGASAKDAAAVAYSGGIQALTAATPAAPITVYDSIVYTIGSTITPTLGTTITYTADGVADVSNDFALQSNVNNTEVLIELLINGSPVGSRVVNMASTGNIYQNAWVNNLAITNGDVLTYRFTADKTVTLTVHDIRIGSHYR